MILVENKVFKIVSNLVLCKKLDDGTLVPVKYSDQVLKNGRVLGVAVEHVIEDSFENISNIDPKTNEIVKQGEAPDLFIEHRTISVKTINEKGGWVTKSALQDMTRWSPGTKSKKFYSPEEWDRIHHIHMTKYDYILLVDKFESSKNGAFSILMVSPEELKPYGTRYGGNVYPHKINREQTFKLFSKFS